MIVDSTGILSNILLTVDTTNLYTFLLLLKISCDETLSFRLSSLMNWVETKPVLKSHAFNKFSFFPKPFFFQIRHSFTFLKFIGFDNNFKQTENKINYIVTEKRNCRFITLVTSSKRLNQTCKITNKSQFRWIQNIIDSIFDCLKTFTLCLLALR